MVGRFNPSICIFIALHCTEWYVGIISSEIRPGAGPSNDISIEFEIRPKFAVLWFRGHSTDHNEILHTSRQCHCRDVCKISLWSVEHILD